MLEQIDVIVGDDHMVVREGVVRVLAGAGDIRVVGEASDGLEVVELIRARRPRVALVDFRMPRLDGAGVAARVRRDMLLTRVLLLSAHTEAAIVAEAMASGAAGFLSKEAGREEILHAVRNVAAGVDIAPPVAAPETVRGILGHVRVGRNDMGVALSPREREVLTGMADGQTVPSMARAMYLAPSTVKTHVQRLYDKLGVSDRGAAVAEAMRRGLLK